MRDCSSAEGLALVVGAESGDRQTSRCSGLLDTSMVLVFSPEGDSSAGFFSCSWGWKVEVCMWASCLEVGPW